MAKRKRPRKRASPRAAPVAAPEEEGADGVTQLAVRIPSRLYRRLKIHSIATGDSMSKIIGDACRALPTKKEAVDA